MTFQTTTKGRLITEHIIVVIYTHVHVHTFFVVVHHISVCALGKQWLRPFNHKHCTFQVENMLFGVPRLCIWAILHWSQLIGIPCEIHNPQLLSYVCVASWKAENLLFTMGNSCLHNKDSIILEVRGDPGVHRTRGTLLIATLVFRNASEKNNYSDLMTVM